MRLNSVVLPDPFGPIRPVIEPSGTTSEAPSTALRPPNCLRRSLTSSSGAVGAPSATGDEPRSVSEARLPAGADAGPDQAGLAARAATQFSSDSIAGQHTLRQEQDDHEHEQTAEEQQPGVAAAEVVVGELVERLDDEGAEHRPPQRRLAADRAGTASICTLSRMLNMPRGSMKVR